MIGAAALALTFAYQIGVSTLALGGGTSLNLAQSGEDYERLYTTPAELAGAKWAAINSQERLLYADRYGVLRLENADGRYPLVNLTPETLDRAAWIYATRTNVVLGRARGESGNYFAIYLFPDGFLHDFFDTVYTNGQSQVFHR